jgi:hypothetical protein
MRKIIHQQGEVRIYEIDAIPPSVTGKPAVKTKNGYIISHSEKGHHHLLTGGDVIEFTELDGMQVFYAILDAPEKLIQDCHGGHEPVNLVSKFYEFRIDREFNPFTEQVRRVAD